VFPQYPQAPVYARSGSRRSVGSLPPESVRADCSRPRLTRMEETCILPPPLGVPVAGATGN